MCTQFSGQSSMGEQYGNILRSIGVPFGYLCYIVLNIVGAGQMMCHMTDLQ